MSSTSMIPYLSLISKLLTDIYTKHGREPQPQVCECINYFRCILPI